MTNQTPSTISPQANGKKPFIIRPGRLQDMPKMGRIAAATYFNTHFTAFLAPNRLEYADHNIRGFQQRAVSRYLLPTSLCFVACDAANPDYIVGYIQLNRLGNDEGAKRQASTRSRIPLWIAGWLWWLWIKIVLWISPDLATDPESMATFLQWDKKEQELHWSSEDRKCRWHVVSLVIREKWQRMGIGRRLLTEGFEVAKRDGVVLGLEASPDGEKLYRSMGMELLGRFTGQAPGETGAGGVFMWDPKKGKKTV